MKRYTVQADFYVLAENDAAAKKKAEKFCDWENQLHDNQFQMRSLYETPPAMAKARFVAGQKPDAIAATLNHASRAWVERNLSSQFDACINEFGGYNADAIIEIARDFGLMKLAETFQERLLASIQVRTT